MMILKGSMMNFTTNLRKYTKRLFYRDTWSIGFRFPESEILPFDYKTKYNIIAPNPRWWFADPFCVKHDHKYYIFCEMLDSFSGKGSIGVFEYSNGRVSGARQVIKESFHMSYPNVFYHKGNFYMIPETERGNQIRLYRSIEFPYKWELDTILADNINVVDSTILILKDKAYIFTYENSEDEYKLLIYQFDIDNKVLIREDGTTILDYFKLLRPAGNFISLDKKIIRPAQFNRDCYGEKLILNEVENEPENGYKESEKCIISASQIITSNNRNFTRIHTINRNNGMEVVDLFETRLCMIKPLFLLVKFIRRLDKR